MKILLTSSDSRVKAGVETYNDYLKSVFQDLKVIDYDQVGGFTSSFIREPMKAFRVDEHLTKNLEKYKPEIIFTNGMYGWALKSCNVPIVNIQHGCYSAYARSAMRFSLDYLRTLYIYSHFEKISAKNSNIVVANSMLTRHNVKKYYNLDSKVINNCIDTETFRPINKDKAKKMLNLPSGRKIVLFVGRPDYSKGFDVIEELAALNKDILFLCVLYPRIIPRLRNIKTVEAVSRQSLRKYYSAADVVLFPSRFEGFGYVPLEALACNTPVISNNVGILRVGRIEGCTIINNNDVTSFNNSLVRDFGKINSRGAIKKRFSFNKFKKKYRDLVGSIVHES